MRVEGLGFGVRVEGLEFGDSGVGLRVWSLGFRVKIGFRVCS